MEDELETKFLEWQLSLEADQQDKVAYDHLDLSLGLLFLRRTADFDRSLLPELRDKVKEVDDHLLVSTIKVSTL